MAGEIPSYFSASTLLDVWERYTTSTITGESKKEEMDLIVIRAGTLIANMIANARIFIGSNLLDTPDQLPPHKIQRFKDLRTHFELFEQKKFQDLATFNLIGTRWITFLPLDKWKPKVLIVSIDYPIPGDNKPLQVVFKGDYPYAEDPRYPHLLEIRGASLPPSPPTKKEMKFTLPFRPDEYKWVQYAATLTACYEIGWVTTSVETAVYRVWLNSPPVYATQVKVVYYKTSTAPENAYREINGSIPWNTPVDVSGKESEIIHTISFDTCEGKHIEHQPTQTAFQHPFLAVLLHPNKRICTLKADSSIFLSSRN